MSASQSQIDPQKRALFENVPIGKAIAVLAIPTIISQLITLVYNLADAYFVGLTGNAHMIAAISLVYPVFSLTTALGNLFGIGGGSLIARLMGKGQIDDARRVSSFSLYAAIASAALYSLVCFIFAEPLLDLLGASSDTLAYCDQYMNYVVCLGGVPTVVSLVLSHLVRNAGYSREAGLGLSIGAILNIVLDPLLMFVILPDGCEVIGAAIATMLSNTISAVYLLRTVIKLRAKSALSADPALMKLDRKGILSVLTVGLPSGLTIFFFDFANMIQNAAIAAHGDLQLAALGIVLKAERIPINAGVGLCQGTMPLVSYTYSGGLRDRMKRAVNYSRLYGLALSAVCIVFYQLCAPFVIRLFLNTGSNSQAALATLGYGIAYLRIRSCGAPFTFSNFHVTYMLQAIGFGKLTLFISLMRLGVIYAAMVFIMDALFGAPGIVASQLSAEILTLLFAVPLLHRAIAKKKED